MTNGRIADLEQELITIDERAAALQIRLAAIETDQATDAAVLDGDLVAVDLIVLTAAHSRREPLQLVHTAIRRALASTANERQITIERLADARQRLAILVERRASAYPGQLNAVQQAELEAGIVAFRGHS